MCQANGGGGATLPDETKHRFQFSPSGLRKLKTFASNFDNYVSKAEYVYLIYGERAIMEKPPRAKKLNISCNFYTFRKLNS